MFIYFILIFVPIGTVLGSYNRTSGNIFHDAPISITWAQFRDAVTTSYPLDYPTRAQHVSFNTHLPSGGFGTKREAAMFLAQILYESGGLAYKEEIACVPSGCPGVHDTSVGVPGKHYYGRGYIQLSHSYNYKAASLDLFGDLRLVENPDLVATDEDIAWRTAFWFWKVRVYPRPGVQQGRFGDSTRAINGLECAGWSEVPKKRFEVYQNVLNAWELNEVIPDESGC